MNKESCKVRKLKQTSLNQKEILIRLVNVDGKTIREASHIIGITESTARNIMCEYRKYSAINNHARGGNNKVKVTDDVREQIEVAVEQHPDATLKEIKQIKR